MKVTLVRESDAFSLQVSYADTHVRLAQRAGQLHGIIRAH